MFRKKAVATPTLAEQVAAARLDGDMYVSAFHVAAKGLEDTADALDRVRDAAAAEAAAHLAVKVEAHDAAFSHRAQAQKIRALIS